MTTPTPESAVIQPWPKSFTALSIKGDDGSELIAILNDGTVRGTIENAGPAAKMFMTELRGMTEAIAAQSKVEALAGLTAEGLIDTRAGLALAHESWGQGASTMLSTINNRQPGEPWEKPASPYATTLLQMINGKTIEGKSE